MGKGILLFGNHPPPFGGVPTHIQYLAPYLASRGWEVHVLSMEGNQAWGVNCSVKVNGYTIHRPSKFLRFSKLFYPSLFAKSSAALKKIALDSPKAFLATLALTNYVKEIVLQHEIQVISAYHIFSAGFVSALVSRELSIPLVTTVFGEIYSMPDMHRKRINAVNYVIETSKRIISCSQHCANSFRVLGLSPKVEPVYYGIDTDKFSNRNDGSVLRRKFGIALEDKVIVFVGRMVREMGLHILLRSIPDILNVRNKARFILVGKSGELLKSAQILAGQHKHNVFVVSDVPFDEIPFYYSAANFVVIPSINDRACLGLAIAEAMATAKPAIVTNIGGGPEVIEAGKMGILIPPDDHRALTDAIVDMLDMDNGVLAEMGSHGRSRAVSIFNKDMTNNRMEQIFSEVCK